MHASGSLVPLLWQKPLDFALLRGTPFNCLVIDPASQPPASTAVEAARQTGFHVISIADAPATVLSDCTWPRVDAGGKDGAASGPTGLPWIETNGWRVRLARAKDATRPVWVRHGGLPEKTALPLTGAAYALAVADAAAHGGAWIVALDSALRQGLAASDPASLSRWRELTAAASFFNLHAGWATMRPQAALGVVSDFAGENEFIATEFLNLLARRQVGYRILTGQHVSQADINGLNALLYAARLAPSRDVLGLFTAFARSGGLSILPASASSIVPSGIVEEQNHAGFNVRGWGQGRIAVAKQDWDDPYTAARDVHMLMSRRRDHLHLFNASSINTYATAGAGGTTALVHLLNYSLRTPAAPVTLAVRNRYRQARLWTLGSSGPAALGMSAEAEWLEMPLPPFSMYAAIELFA
ncbi:MAG: hypothetical protein LLG20_08735 [Acidobacteriales bacterium]|nr:hypothetical protein [Terriglobales bacterium]